MTATFRRKVISRTDQPIASASDRRPERSIMDGKTDRQHELIQQMPVSGALVVMIPERSDNVWRIIGRWELIIWMEKVEVTDEQSPGHLCGDAVGGVEDPRRRIKVALEQPRWMQTTTIGFVC